MRNFCRENGKRCFSCEERIVTTSNKVKIRKIRKTWPMTKTKSSEFVGAKIEIFSEKVILGPRKIFPSPQTRRQVSATAKTHQSKLLPKCPIIIISLQSL